MSAQNQTLRIEYEGTALADADRLFLKLVEVPQCVLRAPQPIDQRRASPLGASTVIVTLPAWALARATLKLVVDELESWYQALRYPGGDDPPDVEIDVLGDETGRKQRYRLEPAGREDAAPAELVFESVRTLIDELQWVGVGQGKP